MTPHMLQVTEANHVESEFFEIGMVAFDTSSGLKAATVSVSHDLGNHVCDNEDRCYFLQVLAEDGWTVATQFEIAEAVAHDILGLEDFEPVRVAERELIRGIQAI